MDAVDVVVEAWQNEVRVKTRVVGEAWQAKANEADALMKRAYALREEADKVRCPFMAGSIERCIHDSDHDGEHRLGEWAWRSIR